MLQPELKFRRDKIRSLMVSQGIDAALITCNANLIYTYGCVVSGYLYLPLHSPALLFFKRPNNITGEHSFSIRKPEQIVDLLKEQGLPMPTKQSNKMYHVVMSLLMQILLSVHNTNVCKQILGNKVMIEGIFVLLPTDFIRVR